jgi:beta-N-acetylhexosaminidase
MAGMTIPMPREKAVPLAIAAGCDMFLFTKDLDEDFGYMRKGVEDGVITPERLDEAVAKILALKAALKLHKMQRPQAAQGAQGASAQAARAQAAGAQAAQGAQAARADAPQGTAQAQLDGGPPPAEPLLPARQKEEHERWARECADRAITLVKEEKGVLPITPEKYRRVLLYTIESELGFAYSVRVGASALFADSLRKEGFDVTIYEPSKGHEGMMEPFRSMAEKYDLMLYFANMGTRSNQTTVRIEWAMPMGANVPIYMESVPTVFISVENPYHLLDVPRVKTFINTYASTDATLEALMEKLTGRSPFKGASPVDAFCGMWDTRL